MRYDILVTNGHLLPRSSIDPPETPSFVAITDGRIQQLGAMTELPQAAFASQQIDATGCLILPGLINTHCHAAMTLFRGLADDLPLMTWLREHIFPAEARFVNPESVYWAARLAAAEMILAGTTCVADGYFHEEAAAQAFCEAGLRAVAAQGIIDFPAPGVPDPSQNIAAAAAFLDGWQGRHPLLTAALFCHSPYTCAPKTLQDAQKAAAERGAPFFIHVAETRAELQIIRERYQATPVEHLAALGVLDEHTVCVHCIWLTEADMDLLQQTGARVAVCPGSHMKLASGTAPVPQLLARRIPVGLGTDGCASNNTLDLFKEMDLCAKQQKVRHHDPTVLPAGQILDLATRGGAAALGLEPSIGTLAAGKKADLITLDLSRPHLNPWYGGESPLVYAARGADVKDVIIDGRMVMADRRLLTLDVTETMEQMRRLAREVTAAT